VYWDAGNTSSYSGSGTTVNDLSGNDVTGQIYGTNGFDSTYNAWEFDGSGDYISGTLSNPSGDWVHSVSLWYRQDSPVTANWDYVYHIGAGASGQASIFATNTSGQIVMTNFSTSSVRGEYTLTLGQWYHITVVYSGGGVKIDNVSIYLDGTIFPGLITDGSGASINLSANANFIIGGRITDGDYTHGSIANFRVFNRALTGDEVWQLYAYQKEYFGHGNLDMALKSGRLGIGTTEPRAVLDVRGDIMGSSPVYFALALDTGNVGATNKIPFNLVRVNKGGGWDPGAKVFTAPIGGYYWMAFGGVNRSTSSVLRLDLKDGTLSGDDNIIGAYDRPYGNSLAHANVSGIVYIPQGGIVTLWCTSSTVDGGGGWGNTASVKWYGFLLSRESFGTNTM